MPNTTSSALLLAICLSAPVPYVLADDLGGDTSRSVGTVVDDTVINGRVKAKLIRSNGVDGSDINVDTRGGVVELEGAVGSEAEMQLAERLAGDVEGVKVVNNRLHVAP